MYNMHTLAIITDLFVSLRTRTTVASLGVDANMLANVLAGVAFVQIPARYAVRIEQESDRTRTNETTFRVLAVILARFLR